MNGDITKSKYEEVFTVRFLHNAYGNPRPRLMADSIELEPDTETKEFFNNYNLGYRFFNDTLICFIRTTLSQLLSPPALVTVIPYIKFSGNVRIRFFINASIDFLNKTLVETAGAKQMYQFTNRVNAGTGGFISMHISGVNNDDLKNVDTVEVDKNKSCFGVVDVYSSGAVDSTYELFSGLDQGLQSPQYSIRFIGKI